MFAVRCTSDAVIAAIDKLNVQAKASIASVNGPKSVVVAGAEAEVVAVLGELGEKGQRLSVSHAFHSPLMTPMGDEFRLLMTALSDSGELSAKLREALAHVSALEEEIKGLEDQALVSEMVRARRPRVAPPARARGRPRCRSRPTKGLCRSAAGRLPSTRAAG